MASMGGTASTFVGMILNNVTVVNMMEVFIYGIIGGMAGLIGKLIIQRINKWLSSKKLLK